MNVSKTDARPNPKTRVLDASLDATPSPMKKREELALRKRLRAARVRADKKVARGELVESDVRDEIAKVEEALRAAQKAYVKGVLRDSLAFAGAKMTRRVVGIAHVADLESIADPDVRAKCELAALACGRRLILEAYELSIDDVAAAAESLRAKF